MINEIQKYIEQKFSYELPEIVVSQRGSTNPKIYSGPGSIHQNENGKLLLKMYSSTSESIKNFFDNKSQPGKLIEEDEYYDITSKDMYGFTWKSEKVSIGKNYGQGGKFLIIYSELQQIFCEADLHEVETTSNLFLYFNKKLRLPVAPFFETPVIKEKEYYNNVRIFSSLKVRDYLINIFERSNWIEVKVSSELTNLPANIDLRICEALQLITYTKLNWFFYEKFESKKNYQKLNTINSHNIVEGLTPPFEINFTTSEPNWKIFKLYLDYIIDYSVPNKYHPISSLLNLIIQAEKLPIETRFQTICICIESILKSEFNLEIEVDSKLLEQQESIVKFIVEHVDKEYQDRIKGLLAQLSNSRPVDKLYKLADDKLIETRLIKDWENLRHRMIHGERIQTENLQEYLNKYYSTLTLFYQLIFLKIGYTGRYTDYSVSNWPSKEFNKTLIK